MDARVVIVEDGGSTSIDLGGEHESVVLGRGRGASLDDHTVSQMHVSLELQRQQQAGTKAEPWVVKMRILGSNPVCVLRNSRSSRSPRDVEFVGRGQEVALRAGDKLSLSIVKPVFYRLKELLNGSRNAGNGDELLGAWKSRSKPEVLEASSSEGKAAALKKQKSLAIDTIPKSVEVSGAGLSNAADLGSTTGKIDPVTDLGFLVEGSEFDKYDMQRKPDLRKWSWKSSRRTEEDEDGGLENAPSTRKRKEDDTEWHGEDEEEKWVLSNFRVPQQRKETRSRAPIQSNVSRSIQPVGRNKRNKMRMKKDEGNEEEDDDDPTLGGFIVDDNIKEEGAEQDGMEEEDEFSDDDSEEEAEDTEMPWCKYRSSCFRKNPEHRLKFRHPE